MKDFQRILQKLVEHHNLSEDEAGDAMGAIMDGLATPAQIGAMLTALRIKGESVDEITGFVRAMRARVLPVPTTRRPLIDTCGTGGDTCKTFNISTTAAFVAAAGGAVVAKHGNRAVTGKCGSADVLEALGVRNLPPARVGVCLDTVGIGFLFARNHHPAMRHAAPVRAELGFRTVFNLLGPLTNPAGARRQLIGVYDSSLCGVLAEVLGRLGADHVAVVHGSNGSVGLDEIATFGATAMTEWKEGAIHHHTLTPESMNLPPADPAELAPGQSAIENGEILVRVLHGEERGARRNIVLANAAAALRVAGLTDTFLEGVEMAGRLIDDGGAIAKLEQLIAFTNDPVNQTPEKE